MAKWIFALLVFVSAGAQANALAEQSGGCIVFDELIYEEVTASGWGITGADLVFTNFREPSVVVCNGATAPVSAEFSQLSGSRSARSAPARGFLSDGAARTGVQLIRNN
jgi:hypothetical protein